ncbi:MAG: hypothetical protein HC892_08165 [Saprospiraceae bacterium]|nr:hypothetical protein [Saprospiraceae bacterium]
MKYITLFFGMFFVLCSSAAQVSGQWKGVITQNEGGYKSKYNFEMYFHQKGNLLRGRSYVYVDNIYVEMELEGIITNGDYIKFQETKMVDSKIVEGLEWCVKGGYLILKKEKDTYILTGIWNGFTSFGTCIPGRIELKRVVPQA